MESQTNPMMVTALIRFTGLLNYDRLVADLEAAVKRFRRLRQRIVPPNQKFRRPYWDDLPTFRAGDNIERLMLPLPIDEKSVERLVNEKMNTALDFALPLWKLTLVDNHPEGSIIIVRLHHCIADGIALMRVLSTLTHASTEGSSAQPPIDSPLQVQQKDILNSAQGRLSRKPNIIDMLAAILRILFRPPDPPTILKKQLGSVKKVAWSEPLSVPEIKKIALYKQATINDVVMAVSTGAIRRYMELHNDFRKRNIRAFIMVNLRGLRIDDELGNNFGLVFLDLPLDRQHPLERLEGVKQGMDTLKASAEYAATYFILNILGMLPGWIEQLATRFLDTKGTIVSTNVPGSRHKLIMADAPIRSMIAWVPQSGRIGVGLSFVSYNNQMMVGLNADAGLIPDPDIFLELFAEEFRSLYAAVDEDTHSISTS
jgi:diacylglycerol O-acyltransferase / wax synthase